MTGFYKAFLKTDQTRFFLRLLFLLACVAMFLNLSVSWKVYRHEPLRDGASRSLMAASSSFFYASGLAEPLPVAAQKLAMAAGIGPDAALRLEGLAALALVFGLTVFVLRKRFGGPAACMAALFLAANPYMGYYAMQGSSHLYALAALLLFWHYFDSPEGGRKHALLAGLYGGLACLSRLDAALFILVIAGLSWAVRRRALPLKEAGLSLGLALLLVLPYLAYQKAQYGGFLYAQELSLRRWANIDSFGYEPGAVRPQGPLSPAAFLLRGGPAGALKDAFGGLGHALSYELPRVLHYKPLAVAVFLGIYAAFALRRYRLLFFLAAALLPVLPLASIKQVPAVGGIELRYYLSALWALFALAGLGFQEIIEWGVKAGIKYADRKSLAAGPEAKKSEGKR